MTTTIHFSGLNHTSLWFISIYRGILASPGFGLSSQSWPSGVPIGLPATL